MRIRVSHQGIGAGLHLDPVSKTVGGLPERRSSHPQNILLEKTANECPGSQSAAEGSAYNTHGPQAKCRTRPRRSAQHSARGHVRPLFEDEELPLACLGSAFSRLPSVIGRAWRTDFCHNG